MKWKNYSCDNGLYFVTTVLRNFTPLFVDERVVAIALGSIDFLRRNKGLKVYAYVVMPDHIHFVASAETTDISTLVGHFKRYTSRRIAQHLQAGNPALFEVLKAAAYKGQSHAVWQETFRSEVIYNNKVLEQKINYIHDNPVRRGLVEDPASWKHSSFNQIEDSGVKAKPGLVVNALVSA